MSNPRLGWIKSNSISSSSSSPLSNTRRSPAPFASTSSITYGSSNANHIASLKDDKNRISEYQTPEDQCPICKSDRYLNPKLRLLISSVCYHKMCESCIERLFTLGPAPCPTCGSVLRKSGFKTQTFEDLRVEEEVAVRARIGTHFNKRKDDFEDDAAYNDYLEEVEDITFNLLNKVDIPETEARIAAYSRANALTISSNAALLNQEAELEREREEAEREEREWRRSQGKEREKEEREKEEKRREDVLKKLEFSSLPPSAIVSTRSKTLASSDLPILDAPPRSALSRLKKRVQIEKPQGPPKPYVDPYDGYEDLIGFKQSGYFDPSLAPFLNTQDKKSIPLKAGGFKPTEVWERGLRYAMAGLTSDVPR
ncbi:Predicted E3 ubiquitin ligase containing RING finger, subunit of transcription/repair factor TFIIH and CDK-activating kinase assembly factor [Phaffia rhodozyma]|uniref:RNA polymerase II transcription factor B subunit 3 n=1 Tax=Phaffia rhodozyma TaxID=264483 RepID=A0A0F7SNV3_PHARH|nr:Predicted E3 ubiquitin ligase containing RING finger, subunit of transcription/repair factor TFIIH and CDK-activating kinase assembly factor [Phaffia rhodozyma]